MGAPTFAYASGPSCSFRCCCCCCCCGCCCCRCRFLLLSSVGASFESNVPCVQRGQCNVISRVSRVVRVCVCVCVCTYSCRCGVEGLRIGWSSEPVVPVFA